MVDVIPGEKDETHFIQLIKLCNCNHLTATLMHFMIIRFVLLLVYNIIELGAILQYHDIKVPYA